MSACPISVTSASMFTPPQSKRQPLTLTPRRLAANRRNAARSTGPRTHEGKARVARNAIKHGFFAGRDRWTSQQRDDFENTLVGLSDDFRPQGILEERCLRTIAESYVRMAAMLRYENLAALKHHQQCERELNERIAAADPIEAARLEAHREQLRRAGLWEPTIPGPREAIAIARYSGRLDRTIGRAVAELETLKDLRIGSLPLASKVQKRCETTSSGVLSASRRTSSAVNVGRKAQKQTHCEASPSSGPEALRRTSNATFESHEIAKTNPLSSMFTGNRHERRRAKALARRRPSP